MEIELKDGVKAFCLGRDEEEIIDMFGDAYDASRGILLYKNNYYKIAIDTAGANTRVVTDAWIIFREHYEHYGILVDTEMKQNSSSTEGHWINEVKGCHYKVLCSKCNSEAINKTKSNYCPHCGARMSEPETKVDKSIKPISEPMIPKGMED